MRRRMRARCVKTVRGSRCERMNKTIGHKIWKFPVISTPQEIFKALRRRREFAPVAAAVGFNSSHFLFGCLVTLAAFMFPFLFLNERTNIEAEKCFRFFVEEKSKEPAKIKQITKTGCACCGRETTKKGNTAKRRRRERSRNQNQIEANVHIYNSAVVGEVHRGNFCIKSSKMSKNYFELLLKSKCRGLFVSTFSDLSFSPLIHQTNLPSPSHAALVCSSWKSR